MKVALAILLILLFCLGCWDTKNINQLAIVTIAAADVDPKTGKAVVLYQVINPLALAKGNTSMKAAVYTYQMEGENAWGELQSKTTTEVPRMLFTAHMQCYILSERYAQKGFLDLLNYLERTPEKRSNVFIFVTDSPVADVLQTFTTLERMPGHFMRSLMEMYGRGTGSSIVFSRVKDIVEGVSQNQPTLVHIIHYEGSKPASSTKRLEEIDAKKESIILTDRAVISHARMVGRIDDEAAKVSAILNKQATRLVREIKIENSRVEVEAYNMKVKRERTSEKELLISIDSNLRILNNQQTKTMTDTILKQFEQQFSLQFEKEATDLVNLAKHHNWDILGLQDQGYATTTKWTDIAITFKAKTKVTSIGKTITPYSLTSKEE